VPPLSHGPQADLPKGSELRATVIAALSLRVSRLNNFFSNLILWYTTYMWNSNVVTVEQLRNHLFAYKLFYLETL
jgi:hypothetical protein